MELKAEEIQLIGLDIGRGYVKGYTEYKGKRKECIFKSIVAMGRELDFAEYDDPIYIEVNNEDYFAGIIAEKEGDNPTQNLKDDKTTPTVKKLIDAALNQLALSDNVKLMIGVPKKLFKKIELLKIQQAYKEIQVEIKDKISKSFKKITISDVKIYREADAALMYYVKNREKFEKTLCMVTIGFRTTEICCYDRNLKFIDKYSKTNELGNKTALEYVQRKLESNGIFRSLNEIDTSTDYDDLKKIGYTNLAEKIEQDIEGLLINLNEVEVCIAGGTALKLNFNDYIVVPDAQMITAKGLYLIATKSFK